MARQLISYRPTVAIMFLLPTLTWYYWCFLFPKELDNTDIVVMIKSYTGEEKDLGGGIRVHRSPYIFVGVKNVCRARPSQYKDFLPKVAASIADTTHENIYIYFLMYDQQVERYAHNSAPYKIEEEIPDAFLLRTYWEGGKKLTNVRWYIPALKSLNTEIPDLLMEDTRVENVK